jgi:hypothetical protein
MISPHPDLGYNPRAKIFRNVKAMRAKEVAVKGERNGYQSKQKPPLS